MFQKGFKKGALPARKVSPLMPINCLINSEQFVNNSCSIRVQFVFNSCSKQNPFVFQETIRAPPKIKAALMNPFMSIDGENRGKSTPKKPTILSVFSAIRY